MNLFQLKDEENSPKTTKMKQTFYANRQNLKMR